MWRWGPYPGDWTRQLYPVETRLYQSLQARPLDMTMKRLLRNKRVRHEDSQSGAGGCGWPRDSGKEGYSGFWPPARGPWWGACSSIPQESLERAEHGHEMWVWKHGGLITVCGGATRPHNNPPPPTGCKGLQGSLDPNQPYYSSSSEVSSGGLTPKTAHPHGGDWGSPAAPKWVCSDTAPSGPLCPIHPGSTREHLCSWN